MNDLNCVTLSGNLTRDSVLKTTTNGFSVLEFSIANNQGQKQPDGTWKDRANFFSCVMFGKRADALAQYLKKGVKVSISGSARHESWTDKETQQKRSKVVFTVDNLVMMSQNDGGQRSEPQQEAQPAQEERLPEPSNVDEDIPF